MLKYPPNSEKIAESLLASPGKGTCSVNTLQIAVNVVDVGLFVYNYLYTTYVGSMNSIMLYLNKAIVFYILLSSWGSCSSNNLGNKKLIH